MARWRCICGDIIRYHGDARLVCAAFARNVLRLGFGQRVEKACVAPASPLVEGAGKRLFPAPARRNPGIEHAMRGNYIRPFGGFRPTRAAKRDILPDPMQMQDIEIRGADQRQKARRIIECGRPATRHADEFNGAKAFFVLGGEFVRGAEDDGRDAAMRFQGQRLRQHGLEDAAARREARAVRRPRRSPRGFFSPPVISPYPQRVVSQSARQRVI